MVDWLKSQKKKKNTETAKIYSSDSEKYIPKEQDKASGKNLKEMEISNLTDQEFRVTVIKMLRKLRRG